MSQLFTSGGQSIGVRVISLAELGCLVGKSCEQGRKVKRIRKKQCTMECFLLLQETFGKFKFELLCSSIGKVIEVGGGGKTQYI